MPRLTAFIIATAATALACVVLVLAVSRITDFDLPKAERQDITFNHGGNRLEGTLIIAPVDGPVMLLVHGDGPQDRWSNSGYLPLVNTLLDAGISVYSWDKPGVGASSGNWLHQSMADRADETVAALGALQQVPGFAGRPMGLLGFSQAGWVLPKVPALTDDVVLLVVMGGAINWSTQGEYYTAIRLEREGKTPAEVAEELARQAAAHRIWFDGATTHETYLATERAAGRAANDPLSRDRFHFAKRNFGADARDDIADLTIPILVLSGAQDLNVNAQNTVSVYRSLLMGVHPLNRFEVVPNATHALLSADHYNYQRAKQWPLSAQARMLLSGRNAFAGDVLSTLTDWTAEVYRYTW